MGSQRVRRLGDHDQHTGRFRFVDAGHPGFGDARGYQPPNFDVDAYTRPSAPRYSQGLSQIREDFPVNPTPGVVRGGGGGRVEAEEEKEEEDEDLGRHPYSNAETLAVYNAWITVSYDPIIGNQQPKKCFWEKVCEVYHQIKPKGSFKRKYKMLRSHFDRVDRQVKKFCGIYSAEAARYQSGATGADILPAALRAYYQDTRQQFKYVDVWQAVKDEERWAGGVRSSSGSKWLTPLRASTHKRLPRRSLGVRSAMLEDPAVGAVGRKGRRRRKRLGRGRAGANQARRPRDRARGEARTHLWRCT